jgi:hypothetical protein
MNLKDGGVMSIDTGYDYTSGCPTCEYGAERTNYVKIDLKKTIVEFIITQTYEYPFECPTISFSQLIKLFDIKNPEEMTQDQFVSYIVGWIMRNYNRFSVRITGKESLDDYAYNDGKWEKRDFEKRD